ncbi:MAG TPA: hypothetical protein PLA41_00275 [Candidatus Pacearchaeota archaeon]|nr:hypothetical protein [Candidatus Parcubacteria bacterium]HNZ84048.1 hypothetical protein [Candidatus Pacearchaeota archaeon]HOU45575.1 hypothetical protein [Candidatus Pacearchaeota archaeon]HPM08438.1 hypothetical protein [Candidatus Pacearchaeota archaeon]HQI74268.1 hypothetical protein [Candidatus Pacearchaeota archaeon]
MKLEDLQKLPIEKKKMILYGIVFICALVLFSWWFSLVGDKLKKYQIEEKKEKVINSTYNYAESLKKAQETMQKVDKQMEEDLKKYDKEMEILEDMATNTATSSVSSSNSTSSIIKEENN